MHEWLNRELAEFRTRGRKLNLIAPRGGAKSTIGTLCYVLQAAVEGWEHYIWIVSDTKQQAQTHLENVKAELIDNLVIARDYPRSAGRGPRWQATSIELANGVVIESYGTGQRIRGRRRREHRPTLIVCDDLQNDSHISSAAQREATRRWFHGTLLKAGTKETNVINLATALHRDAPGAGAAHGPRLDERAVRGDRTVAGESGAVAGVGGDLYAEFSWRIGRVAVLSETNKTGDARSRARRKRRGQSGSRVL